MANKTWYTSRKDLDIFQITSILNDINKNKFKNTLEIENFDNGWFIKIDDFPMGIWLSENKRRLEWYHQLDFFKHWLMMSITSILVRTLNSKAKIHDDGISETLKPNFDQQYPKLENWTKAMMIRGDDIDIISIYQQIHSKFFDVFGKG